MIAHNMIRPEPTYRRAAFDEGLKRAGYKLAPVARPNGPNDLLVMWNRHKGANERRAEEWERAGGTVIVAENGYLQKTDKTMYALSVGQHNGAGWFPVGDEDRFSRLGFELKPWRRADHGEIVVRAQRGIGSALMSSPQNWAEKTAAKLRALTKLPVRIAQHPGDKGKGPIDSANLDGAHALVIWSSAMGVRALVEGVPVFYAAPHWVCELAALNLRPFPDAMYDDVRRKVALHRMAHGQWGFDEISTGEPFVRMREGKWGRKC